MGLLTILKKMRQKEQEMRILLLGLDNAGKTTLVRSLTGESVDTVAPTLGFSIVSMQHGSYTLNLWDVGGQKSLRSYWRNYFEATDGVIWVVDSADILRLSDCRDELHSLLKDERLLGATLLVLANKQDLPGAVDEAQVAKELQLHSGCIDSSHHWRVMAASARTGSNVVEGVQWMVDDIASRVFTMD